MSESDVKLKRFIGFLEWTSALGLGGLAAFIFSLKQVNPVVRFDVSVWTWVVLALATTVSWWGLRAVLGLAEGQNGHLSSSQLRRAKIVRMAVLALILFGGTMASFFYSLGNVSTQKRFDVAVGTGTAILFVSVAMFGFWRLVCFLERQGDPDPDQEPIRLRGGDENSGEDDNEDEGENDGESWKNPSDRF